MPRLHQLRDMHDDLTLDAELDLDLDEELRVMSFLRTPHSRVRTRSLALLSPQYSVSPASSPSALRHMSPPKQRALSGHRSLPLRLSSPVRSPPPRPPTISPQRSPSPQRTASRRNSFSTQGYLSPRYSLTSQLTGSTGTLPLSPSSSGVIPPAAAPARMPAHVLRVADQAAPQLRLSHAHLVAQQPARAPAATAALRSSAPTSLSAATQRSHAMHAVDSESSCELALDAAVRAPLSCQGLLPRSASATDAQPATAACAAADACLPCRASMDAATPAPPAHASKLQRDALPGGRQRDLPGYESSDAGSGGESDDDCSMGTLTLTPALAAECSELVRALAAEQSRS